ncbi:hypothetical protein NKR23_g1123 [Pleurostoma richardsiae]|uniref:Secreted protein n=1 Tax=Pleurostoma richardsiae TaxID=41990 RepID=A0AA38VZF2_9PEZI|nr:hypothetical protein NKR23_g1123 [Pleurostoma richardsiae]
MHLQLVLTASFAFPFLWTASAFPASAIDADAPSLANGASSTAPTAGPTCTPGDPPQLPDWCTAKPHPKLVCMLNKWWCQYTPPPYFSPSFAPLNDGCPCSS